MPCITICERHHEKNQGHSNKTKAIMQTAACMISLTIFFCVGCPAQRIPGYCRSRSSLNVVSQSNMSQNSIFCNKLRNNVNSARVQGSVTVPTRVRNIDIPNYTFSTTTQHFTSHWLTSGIIVVVCNQLIENCVNWLLSKQNGVCNFTTSL